MIHGKRRYRQSAEAEAADARDGLAKHEGAIARLAHSVAVANAAYEERSKQLGQRTEEAIAAAAERVGAEAATQRKEFERRLQRMRDNQFSADFLRGLQAQIEWIKEKLRQMESSYSGILTAEELQPEYIHNIAREAGAAATRDVSNEVKRVQRELSQNLTDITQQHELQTMRGEQSVRESEKAAAEGLRRVEQQLDSQLKTALDSIDTSATTARSGFSSGSDSSREAALAAEIQALAERVESVREEHATAIKRHETAHQAMCTLQQHAELKELHEDTRHKLLSLEMPEELDPDEILGVFSGGIAYARERNAREAFRAADLDHSDAVDSRELGRLLDELGHTVSQAQLDKAMAELDQDHNGVLTEDEFIRLMNGSSQSAVLRMLKDDLNDTAAFETTAVGGGGSMRRRASLDGSLSLDPMTIEDDSS